MKKLKGFTLIELMIVVAIISILASVAFSAYDKENGKKVRPLNYEKVEVFEDNNTHHNNTGVINHG